MLETIASLISFFALMYLIAANSAAPAEKAKKAAKQPLPPEALPKKKVVHKRKAPLLEPQPATPVVKLQEIHSKPISPPRVHLLVGDKPDLRRMVLYREILNPPKGLQPWP